MAQKSRMQRRFRFPKSRPEQEENGRPGKTDIPSGSSVYILTRRFPGEAVPFPVSGNNGVLFVAFSQEVALPVRKISLFFFGKTS